jgi:RNase P subunit RPR2
MLNTKRLVFSTAKVERSVEITLVFCAKCYQPRVPDFKFHIRVIKLGESRDPCCICGYIPPEEGEEE